MVELKEPPMAPLLRAVAARVAARVGEMWPAELAAEEEEGGGPCEGGWGGLATAAPPLLAIKGTGVGLGATGEKETDFEEGGGGGGGAEVLLEV